jgi:hypothetical protein
VKATDGRARAGNDDRGGVECASWHEVSIGASRS